MTENLAADLEREPGEVAELGGADLDVEAEVAKRAAVVRGVEKRELLLVGYERLGELEQESRPLLRRSHAPPGRRRFGDVD